MTVRKIDNSVKVGSHRRTASRGRIADNPNMKKLHIPFPFRYIEYSLLSPLILPIDCEEEASVKPRNLRIIWKYKLSIK